MTSRARIAAVLLLGFGNARLPAQAPEVPPRRPSAAESGCDSTTTDGLHWDAVGLFREVLTGRSVFRFVVEASGRIDRCSIAILEETSRAWSGAVLKELRVARYEPARKGGQPVRQLVHQVFTYHSDGRLQPPR